MKSSRATVMADAGRITVRKKDKCLVITPDEDGKFEINEGGRVQLLSYAAMLDEVLDWWIE